METLTAIIIAILYIAAIAVIMAFPVMWLWNYFCPTVLGLPQISFYQALALNILCSILFKSSTSSKKE